ncbi:RNA polymerase sigma factor SigZ [Adhaeribacter aerolatus]|uniref:RNA polymerase sigma factor SigZ n=1 Tax=Adhaeribacter aerolatus TaxID=670289 RepID=A0A512B2S4_9BACT|nr:sigma-70 family RNA polymerase sigma factor [Adhaeribacter aerolatus]GEO06244.1 RNA polymerase sigma factor SigZ [Adhaeribacter aerolatus]
MNNQTENNCCQTAPALCGQVAPFFLAYEEKLKGFIQKQVRDTDATHDIAQGLFLKIYQHCESLPEIKNPKAWLYQVTRNAVMDYFRMNKPGLSLEVAEETLSENDGNFAQDVLELVAPLISMLPEKYAQPLYLSDIQGLSHKDIAAQLNLSLSNTKSRIQRGREKLKVLFQECCYLELDRSGRIMQAEARPDCLPLQQLLDKKQ